MQRNQTTLRTAVLVIGLALLTHAGLAAGTWVAEELPISAGTHLEAIWGSGAGDIFVAGDNGKIVHFDGAAWSTMTSGTTKSLVGLWGTGPADVYAVGENGTLLHYNGTDWSAMASGTVEPLYGVWGSGPTDVFAVGATGTILHYDGIIWSKTVYRIHGGTPSFFALWGTAANNVYALGSVVVMATGEAPRVTILHYDGAEWSTMITSTDRPLYSAWSSGPTSIDAVGHSGEILHFAGANWSPVASGVSYWLEGAWGAAPDDIYAVGGYGTGGAKILHYDGANWSEVYSDDLDILHAVWGSSATNIYATSSGGTVLHYTVTDGSAGDSQPGPVGGLCGAGAVTSAVCLALPWAGLLCARACGRSRSRRGAAVA